MPTRAKYANNAFTRDGLVVNVVPNASVTLFEPGTTTPLAATIYAAATGGATLTNPFVTDADGNIEFYLEAAQDVKITATGVGVGTLTADFVRVFPSASDLIYQDQAAEAGVAGGFSATRDDNASYAFTAQNLDTVNGLGFRIRTPSNVDFVRSGRSSVLGNDAFLIDTRSAGAPDNTLFLVGHRPTNSYVVADFVLEAQGTGGTQDAGALRGVADQRNANGNSLIRALEGRARRLAPAIAAGTWGAELNVTSDVASPGDPTYYVGAYIAAGSVLVGEVRADSGVYVGGPAGWRNGYYFADESGDLLFRVASGSESGDNPGDVPALGDLYSFKAGSTFRVGVINHEGASSPNTYAGLHFDNGTNIKALVLGALTGGVAYRPILLAPNGSSVGVNLTEAGLAAGAGGASAGAMATTLFVNGSVGVETTATLKQIATPSAPNSGYTSLYTKSGGGLYSIASGSAEKQHKTGSQSTMSASAASGTVAVNTYSDVTNGFATLTTTGGNLLVTATLCQSNSAAGSAMYLALSLDGGAEVGEVVTIESDNNSQFTQTVVWLFTGVSAAIHTVKMRWKTSGGTSTAYSGRVLLTEEAH